jgi:6-phospho-beta-glucosidase
MPAMIGPKLTVLGGSSPFTVSLVDALVNSGIEAKQLTLHGRDHERLQLVRAYATGHLGARGWRVACTTDVERALDGADIVLHQIRYGGLAARHHGEVLAARHGMTADETLGPLALSSGVRMSPHLESLAELLHRWARTAWVLNLTNPLSVAVAVLAAYGVRRCLGLCELPVTTAGQIASLLDTSPQDLGWSYSGLNHRGFIHHLSVGGDDPLEALAALVRDGALGGINPRDILELQAVPLKYFSLVRGTQAGAVGRADHLERLRAQISAELAVNPLRPPPSVGQRTQDWYPHAVAPVLCTLWSDDRKRHIVDVNGPDGIVIEGAAEIRPDGISAVEGPAPGPEVQRWLDRFARHEKAVVAAALDPSRQRIRSAIESDPTVPAPLANTIASEVWLDLCHDITKQETKA